MKVDKERLVILKKGSLTGYMQIIKENIAFSIFSLLHRYFALPHSVVCSRICATPVESVGVVLNVALNYHKLNKKD